MRLYRIVDIHDDPAGANDEDGDQQMFAGRAQTGHSRPSEKARQRHFHAEARADAHQELRRQQRMPAPIRGCYVEPTPFMLPTLSYRLHISWPSPSAPRIPAVLSNDSVGPVGGSGRDVRLSRRELQQDPVALPAADTTAARRIFEAHGRRIHPRAARDRSAATGHPEKVFEQVGVLVTPTVKIQSRTIEESIKRAETGQRRSSLRRGPGARARPRVRAGHAVAHAPSARVGGGPEGRAGR